MLKTNANEKPLQFQQLQPFFVTVSLSVQVGIVPQLSFCLIQAVPVVESLQKMGTSLKSIAFLTAWANLVPIRHPNNSNVEIVGFLNGATRL